MRNFCRLIKYFIIGLNSGLVVYYSDTDSIYIEDYLPEELVDSKKLGMWKLEDEYIYAVFIGPKT